jgi:hypothetical protein
MSHPRGFLRILREFSERAKRTSGTSRGVHGEAAGSSGRHTF